MKAMMLKAAIAGIASTVGFAAVNLEAAYGQTFKFTDPAPTERATSFFYAEDGLGVTVTGFRNNSQALVAQTDYGLGVRSGFLDSDQADGGIFTDESLLFDFGEHVVDLVSVKFSKWGGLDEFELFVDDEFELKGGPFASSFFDFSDITGSQFKFKTTDSNDDWYIKRLTVAKVAVPEPATMLGLGAVAAAGLLAQKRSRKEEVA